jgi:hypothetical protein
MSKFHSHDNPPFSCLRIAYPVPPGRTSSGSLAKFAAMRRASSFVSSFAAERRPARSQNRSTRAPARWRCGRIHRLSGLDAGGPRRGLAQTVAWRHHRLMLYASTRDRTRPSISSPL